MTKIRIIKAKYAGYKIKIDNTVVQQLPTLELAKERVVVLATSCKENKVEIFDEEENLLETLKI